MGLKMRRRTVYVATIVAMLAMVGGWALATTTSTSGPAQDTNITTSQPAGFSVATVTSSQTVTVSSAIAAYSTAGTQDTSTAGLAGTPVALTACPTTGGCVQNFNTVNGVTVTAADYAEQIEISVAQPASGGTATGFDMQIDILTNSGHVFGDAYISTATAQSTAQTVIVYLFVDLGVNTVTSPPTITSISVQFNSCLSTTSCP